MNIYLKVEGNWNLFSFNGMVEFRVSKEAKEKNIKIGDWAEIGDGAKIGDWAKIGARAEIDFFISFAGYPFLTYAWDGHIQVGCESHSVKEWDEIIKTKRLKDKVSEKDYSRMTKYFKTVKTVLKLLESQGRTNEQ